MMHFYERRVSQTAFQLVLVQDKTRGPMATSLNCAIIAITKSALWSHIRNVWTMKFHVFCARKIQNFPLDIQMFIVSITTG